ncbi:winged helix-turn-helix transcriptional regulator [Streptomyces sparsus]
MSVGHTAVTTPATSDASPGPGPSSGSGLPARSAPVTGEAVVACGEPHEDCGIRPVLDRLGDKWSVLVVVELAAGVRRFRQLQRSLPGISQRMLTLTVRRLERDGLVSRTVYPTVPPQVEYELTAMGHSLTHLLKTLADWSREHRDAIAAAHRAWDADDPGTAVR